jgi:teichuronic acid biosynthesis glycosyltransferase TuaG
MNNGLVSIVIPVYNASNYIIDTLNSVVNQTYTNWELFLVDDMSTDESVAIIKDYIKNNNLDNKITLLETDVKLTAAGARNKGIAAANGHYLCYLDADDFWDEYKLQKQVNFMEKKQCAFSFTSYMFANELGKVKGKKVTVPRVLDYKHSLRNTIIWTCTVMFDLTKIDKELIYMPLVKSEDTASWWKILKHGYKAHGLNEVLSYYRRNPGSLSSNKFEGIRRIWNLYRNVEHLGILESCFNFIGYAFHAVWKRI